MRLNRGRAHDALARSGLRASSKKPASRWHRPSVAQTLRLFAIYPLPFLATGVNMHDNIIVRLGFAESYVTVGLFALVHTLLLVERSILQIGLICLLTFLGNMHDPYILNPDYGISRDMVMALAISMTLTPHIIRWIR